MYELTFKGRKHSKMVKIKLQDEHLEHLYLSIGKFYIDYNCKSIQKVLSLEKNKALKSYYYV
jgi:hypothetical protein